MVRHWAKKGRYINKSLVENNNKPIQWDEESLSTLAKFQRSNLNAKYEMIENSADPIVAQLGLTTICPLDIPSIATRHRMLIQEAPQHEWLWWKHVYGMRDVEHEKDGILLRNPTYAR